jgi:hypothetical protein
MVKIHQAQSAIPSQTLIQDEPYRSGQAFAHRIPLSLTGEDKERRSILNRFAKTAVAALIATALVWFVAAAPQAHADDRSHCQHAIEKAEANLDRAIHDHGDHSPQADDRRRDLNAERQKCWDQYHQWWNGKEHRWETEHTWDANPH